MKFRILNVRTFFLLLFWILFNFIIYPGYYHVSGIFIFIFLREMFLSLSLFCNHHDHHHDGLLLAFTIVTKVMSWIVIRAHGGYSGGAGRTGYIIMFIFYWIIYIICKLDHHEHLMMIMVLARVRKKVPTLNSSGESFFFLWNFVPNIFSLPLLHGHSMSLFCCW